MTFVYEIINDAFRESNLTAVGETPTLEEQQEALILLNRFVSSAISFEAGDPLDDYNIGTNNVLANSRQRVYDFTSNQTVPLNARLFANLSSSQTINLNPQPKDGSRLNIIDVSGNFSTYPLTLTGNGRKIDGAITTTLNTNSLNQTWFFRADTGDWVTVSKLALTDTFPFPEKFDDFFEIGLALRLNPRNGVPLDPQSIESFKRAKTLFRAQYKQTIEVPLERGLYYNAGFDARFFTNGD